MIFALDFAPDAKSQWLALEVPLQELVLDELDSLCTAETLHRRAVFFVDVFLKLPDGRRHFAFIEVRQDVRLQTILVISVVEYVSKHPPST